jgi:predicted glycosyltransferase
MTTLALPEHGLRAGHHPRSGSPRGDAAPAPRFLLYSHDGLGLGHVRRNINLATAITAASPDASALIVTGVEDLDVLATGGVDVLRLPGLRKLANERYAPRRLPVEGGVLWQLRAGLLAAAVEHFRPDVLVADKHPGGVHGELVPALSELRASGGRAALGLRDVIDCDDQARQEWREGGQLRRYLDLHDLILVYGQADLLDPLVACGLPPSARARARFCSYVVPPPPMAGNGRRERGSEGQRPARARPVVLAMAGGGEDGAPVLRAFLGAAAGTEWDARVVTGPHAPRAERAALEDVAAASGARIVSSVRDLAALLWEVDAVVCMGGYNSLVEVFAAGVPAVCVPRVSPRREQLVRAEAFAARGLLRLVTPEALGPSRLRREVEAALATDRDALARRIRRVIDLNGAARAAAALLELAATAAVRRDGDGVSTP